MLNSRDLNRIKRIVKNSIAYPAEEMLEEAVELTRGFVNGDAIADGLERDNEENVEESIDTCMREILKVLNKYA